jgi:hypothetical protein
MKGCDRWSIRVAEIDCRAGGCSYPTCLPPLRRAREPVAVARCPVINAAAPRMDRCNYPHLALGNWERHGSQLHTLLVSSLRVNRSPLQRTCGSRRTAHLASQGGRLALRYRPAGRSLKRALRPWASPPDVSPASASCHATSPPLASRRARSADCTPPGSPRPSGPVGVPSCASASGEDRGCRSPPPISTSTREGWPISKTAGPEMGPGRPRALRDRGSAQELARHRDRFAV